MNASKSYRSLRSISRVTGKSINNVTMRMHMRRFTRLTNAFSKKYESYCYMVALYTVWYNFIRRHKTLKTTPAVAAGLAAC
jgi:hypothetical protein